MKALVLLFFVGLASLHAQIREMPESRSHDGKWAVFYSKPTEDEWTFSVRAISGKETFPLASAAAIKDLEEEKLMYQIAGIALDSWFSGEGRGAEECRVSWNAENTLLSVEAGAHKFGAFRVYRKSAAGLSVVPFPEGYEHRLIDFAKAGTHKVHEMGVNRYPEKKSLLTDGADVRFLGNDYIAVNTYGAECHRAFQELPEEIQSKTEELHLFFLFHLGAEGPARFVGFCH